MLQARTTPGTSQSLGVNATVLNPDSVLYFVTLRYLSPTTGEEYALSYYLQIFDQAIVPSDVSFLAWYYDAVEYVLARGFFSGTGQNTFSPNASMTRAMLWTVLANLDGQTLTPGEQWYSGAQLWAAQAGVSDGSDPNGSITREQLALMLYNLAAPGQEDNQNCLAAFSDADSVSPWARQALNWAVGQGILSGRGSGILDPQGTASRAEVAAMLRQYTQLNVE